MWRKIDFMKSARCLEELDNAKLGNYEAISLNWRMIDESEAVAYKFVMFTGSRFMAHLLTGLVYFLTDLLTFPSSSSESRCWQRYWREIVTF
jgi:hypothetical protein